MVTAISELKRSIAALPDFAQFYVVLFASQEFRPDFEADGWLKATRGNKNRMSQWLDTQVPSGGTMPTSAFDVVLRLPQPPDVIFFLTDGAIQDGTFLYQLENLTKDFSHRLSINTIGFSAEAGSEILQQIARQYRGVYRFVPTRGGEKEQ
jgi:hypothetical protein